MVQKVDFSMVKNLVGKGDLSGAEKFFNGSKNQLETFLKGHSLFSKEVAEQFKRLT